MNQTVQGMTQGLLGTEVVAICEVWEHFETIMFERSWSIYAQPNLLESPNTCMANRQVYDSGLVIKSAVNDS